MYNFVNNNGFSVDIQLENGVYLFYGESASGKTYLKKVLDMCRASGENVVTYDYRDYCNGVSLRDRLSNGYKVIMIDRYDMFHDTDLDTINSCRDSSIILIDCKRGVCLENKSCDIELLKEGIMVYE